jgi:hypothetical protein
VMRVTPFRPSDAAQIRLDAKLAGTSGLASVGLNPSASPRG